MLFNEAILRRIPLNHPKIHVIEKEYSRCESGYKGEKRLDFFLDYLPEKNYHIFQGLRLPNDKSHFQIDAFIYTPSCGFSIENKNMKGELVFDEKNNQLVQKIDDMQNGYEDPLLQVKLHVRQLKELLRKHQFPNIPIEHLVMMSNSNAVLKTALNSEAQFRVCRGRQIVFKIEELTRKYQEEKLDRKLIHKLNRFLLKNNTEPNYDIEKLYQIPRSDLLTGVHCPKCMALSMIYYHGSWLCPKCGCKSKDAYLPSLKDYYLLFGPFITN